MKKDIKVEKVSEVTVEEIGKLRRELDDNTLLVIEPSPSECNEERPKAADVEFSSDYKEVSYI